MTDGWLASAERQVVGDRATAGFSHAIGTRRRGRRRQHALVAERDRSLSDRRLTTTTPPGQDCWQSVRRWSCFPRLPWLWWARSPSPGSLAGGTDALTKFHGRGPGRTR